MKLIKLLAAGATAISVALLAGCSSAEQNGQACDGQACDGGECTLTNLKTRRAIRSYEDRLPDPELLDKVLEAGTYAPTGMGLQSPIIVAVTDKAMRDSLAAMNARVMGRDTDPFYGAPAVLVVLADKSVPTYLYDGALVMGNLMNAAQAVGLGTCWIHRAKEVFDTDEGKALLRQWGIEGNYEGIGNCIIGYTKGEVPAPKARKDNYIYRVD